MITNEHATGSNPEQQPAGYKQSEQKDHEGEQNAYGQTGGDFDANSQQSNRNEPSKDEPFSTGNLAGDDDDDDDSNGRNDDNKVIPEVPQREEEYSTETPVAGKAANNEGIDRFDVNSSDRGTTGPIDDSSKFSE